jgi:hypothetical protein
VPVGIAARTNTAAIALPILLLALAEPACAQADCATHPPRPDSPAVVTGSPGERLYIQPQHPSLCKDVQLGTCKAKSYVLTGDAVRVAPECDNWVFMSFAGKKATTSESGRPASTRTSVRAHEQHQGRGVASRNRG